MSVKVSLLKRAKQVVDEWLEINYDGEYNLFYSTGTKDKNFKNQFLKIRLDCSEKYFGLYATKIRNILLEDNLEFEDLSMKIFPYIVK